MREYNWLTEREVSFHLGGAKGGLGSLNFWNNKNMQVFATNSQSRFASVVLDGVLGLPSLVQLYEGYGLSLPLDS